MLLALAALAVDPLGRLLLLPAAGLLLALALRDLLLRPTLTGTTDGLTLVTGLHRVTVPWADVEVLRVVTDRRAPLLEIDLGDTVVVLSRGRLGAPPYAVLEDLQELRATLCE